MSGPESPTEDPSSLKITFSEKEVTNWECIDCFGDAKVSPAEPPFDLRLYNRRVLHLFYSLL